LRTYNYNEQCSDSWWRVLTNRLVMTVSEKEVAKINIKKENVDEIACLYLLVNENENTVYVGETENAKERIGQHRKSGPKSKRGKHEFNKISIIWDGRPIQTTKFSDNTIRKELEASLIRAFDGFGMLKPVNASSSGSRANLSQEETIKEFRDEMFVILYKFGYLKEIPEEVKNGRSLTSEETERLLSVNNFQVEKRRGAWITCDGDRTVYSVSASPKKAGWQITIRDDLMKMFEGKNEGLYVLLQRTKPYLLPSSFLGPLVLKNKGENTVDIYIDDQRNRLKCGKQNDIDIGEYSLRWPTS